jgi:hypothetical protein
MRRHLLLLFCSLTACNNASQTESAAVGPIPQESKTAARAVSPSAWYVPQLSGHVSDNGDEARVCNRAEFTPDELATNAQSFGWHYTIKDIATDPATGKPTVVHFTIKRPGEPDNRLIYFRDREYCRRLTAQVGEQVIDLDRYK